MENNPKSLSKSAQAVQAALTKKGLPFTVVEIASSTRTAEHAAQAIGCEIGQIVKSLIFSTKNSRKAILVLASGPNRVDENIIEKYVGEALVKADADFTRDATGFAIGGIPPVGHPQPIETYIDEDLMNFDIVWAAAGTPHAVFSIPSKSLVALTQGKVVSIYAKK